MAKIDVTRVEGFEELNKKLKQLDDKVKRTEVLKIQRRLAKPIVDKYSAILPKGKRSHSRTTGKGTDSKKAITYTPGNLSRSVKAETVPKSKSGGNPAIAIRPAKKGSNDGYYRFFVVPPGTKLGSTKRGSRKGKNTVVDDARDEAWKTTSSQAIKEAEDKTAKYIQKQIDRLSK